MAVHHENVGDVRERRAVADDAGESHLAAAVEGAEADRVVDRPLHDLAGNPLGPVGPGEELVDRGQVEPRRIRGDQDVAVLPKPFDLETLDRMVAGVGDEPTGA